MGRKAVRKTDYIQIKSGGRQRDSTGGYTQGGEEIVVQSTLAEVKENVRVPMTNSGEALQLTDSISFTIWKDQGVNYGPQLFINWRSKRLTIQSVRTLTDIRKVEIIANYGIN